jgi:hypothetical protein
MLCNTMSVMLPKEINYDLPVSLPSNVSSMNVSIVPVNGSSFSCATAGQIVQFDLPARGYSDFKTLSIRYNATCVATGFSKMRCTPLYGPFQRLEVLFAGQGQNINAYNQTMNMLVNTRMSVADKIATSVNYGWKLEGANVVQTLQGCDGRSCTGTDAFTLSGPLPCICDRYLPTGMMPPIRVQITLDSIANIFAPADANVIFTTTGSIETGNPASSACVVPTDFILSDFCLNYNVLDFGPEIDNAVRSMGEKISIKSQGYSNVSNTLPTGTNGQVELIYSTKLASIKSLFLHCSVAGTTNGIFDAYEVTTLGDCQFNVGGKFFPQSRPLSAAVANRAMLLLDLKKACGDLYNKSNTTINNQELLTIVAFTVVNPAKSYCDVSTQVLQGSESVLLSGTSTNNSPTTCRLNITQATPATVNAALIAAFDCLIEIEPAAKGVRVIQ